MMLEGKGCIIFYCSAHISLFIALHCIAFCLFVYHDMYCAIWSYGRKIE